MNIITTLDLSRRRDIVRMERLKVLKIEYFNEFTDEDLECFARTMESRYYGSDEVIKLLKEYSDNNNLRRV